MSLMLSISIILSVAIIAGLIGFLALNHYHYSSSNFKNQLYSELEKQQQSLHIKHLDMLQNRIDQGMSQIREQLLSTLQMNTAHLGQTVDKLTQTVNQRLTDISGQVDKRLDEGFQKTTETFTDVIKRLALIDQAQQRITELSSNVMSLQDILNDKRTRGAFGEVQLTHLIHNVMPEGSFKLQHTLSNAKRVDCLLLLPEPTGNIAIDAKFPLETYQHLVTAGTQVPEYTALKQQFKQDIRKHIQDISGKYILPKETADGAVMFIPAEAVFAEIHANFPELVAYAHQLRVWLVSPTTMMAILTTARAVIKDEATRKQVHIIQDHLVKLGQDFERFQKRMDQLATHIGQAHKDVESVHKSSQKITRRFQHIERVELEEAGHTIQETGET